MTQSFLLRLSQVITLIVSAVAVSTFVPRVQAQETITPEKYAQLRTEYRAKLDDYRSTERQYVIATEQYQQLNTLTSLEAALQATKNAMLKRADVLEAYMTLQTIQLQTATGVNLSQKAEYMQRLTNNLNALKQHRDKVQQAETRQAVNQVATEFAEFGKTLESDSVKVQTLLTLGKLQTIYDKSSTLLSDMEQSTKDLNDIKQVQRQRAAGEVRALLESTKTKINEVTTNTIRPDVDFSEGSFDSLLSKLNEIYAGLSQSLTYLDEFLRI